MQVQADSGWQFDYQVAKRPGVDQHAQLAYLERRIQAKCAADPRFAIPHDRFIRHFAKYNTQYDSAGQPLFLGPPSSRRFVVS